MVSLMLTDFVESNKINDLHLPGRRTKLSPTSSSLLYSPTEKLNTNASACFSNGLTGLGDVGLYMILGLQRDSFQPTDKEDWAFKEGKEKGEDKAFPRVEVDAASYSFSKVESPILKGSHRSLNDCDVPSSSIVPSKQVHEVPKLPRLQSSGSQRRKPQTQKSRAKSAKKEIIPTRAAQRKNDSNPIDEDTISNSISESNIRGCCRLHYRPDEALKAEIEETDIMGESSSLPSLHVKRRKELFADFWKYSNHKLNLLFQKSSVRWITDGDVNLRFLHACINGRRVRNQILCLKMGDRWVDNEELLRDEIAEFYKNLFHEHHHRRPKLDDFVRTLDLIKVRTWRWFEAHSKMVLALQIGGLSTVVDVGSKFESSYVGNSTPSLAATQDPAVPYVSSMTTRLFHSRSPT
ncbi:hypothetical protein RIF29_15077 [Crotalaria pallida]|uniref:Uncharacterized protein n=1 Tax=Crotalaria pallida TaxID=3830 RepID=A0AAN9FL84_CROPI